MMNEPEKSDLFIVATKRANKRGRPRAESVERRERAEGNAGEQRTHRTLSRASVSQRLERVRARARKGKEKFTALMHHVTVDVLDAAFGWLKRDAAAGTDGVTWHDYARNREANLIDLHARLHRGAYRAKPVRRQYIPKPDGRQRPLGIAALEDKIVQRALVEVLNAVYEQDFLGFSYGFRPGRGQHDALDALAVGIDRMRVNWIVDADIARFFDTVSHEWLLRFAELRIGDPRVLRLLRKWLKAGVMEDGVQLPTETGTPQGAVISPLLANIYLHYVFDLWAQRWRKCATGRVIIVRYADDIVVGFSHEAEARRFVAELRERLEKFALTLHPEKTRVLEFGRFAAKNRGMRGLHKPETFDFLGFTHIAGTDARGIFQLQRKTRRDRLRAMLRTIKESLMQRLHDPIAAHGEWLGRVVRGYFAYHAVPTNFHSLDAFRHYVLDLWRRALNRRSFRTRTTWARITRIAEQWLPRPRILHPWPSVRFAVNHPRWEPGA
ncbi:MAG: group II intron reverse transcriptase/maturase [Dongiaceae bacterium]